MRFHPEVQFTGRLWLHLNIIRNQNINKEHTWFQQAQPLSFVLHPENVFPLKFPLEISW